MLILALMGATPPPGLPSQGLVETGQGNRAGRHRQDKPDHESHQ